jgi:hypothetical protein
MRAMLLDALEILETALRRPTARHLRDGRMAAEWIRDDREWLFSFRTVCEVLGLDPVGVRKRLDSKGLLP